MIRKSVLMSGVHMCTSLLPGMPSGLVLGLTEDYPSSVLESSQSRLNKRDCDKQQVIYCKSRMAAAQVASICSPAPMMWICSCRSMKSTRTPDEKIPFPPPFPHLYLG